MSEQEVENFQQEEKGFDAKYFFYKYFVSFWYMYVVTIFLALIVAYYYNWYTTPVYSAKATVLVKGESKSATKDLLAELDQYYDVGGIENEIGILSSRTVIIKALQELNFEVTYTLRGNIKTSELYTQSPVELKYESLNFKVYGLPLDLTILDSGKYTLSYQFPNDENTVDEEHRFGEQVDNKIGKYKIIKREPFSDSAFNNPAYEKRNFILHINSYERLADTYIERLKIESVSKKSTILALSMTDHVPQKAGDFLNKLIEVYLRSGVEQKNELAQNSLKFIDDQLALISQQVDTSEKSVAAYKSSKGIADLSTEAQTVLGSAKLFDDRISEIDMQLGFLNYLEEYVNEGKNLKEISPASIGINDILLQKLIQQLSDLRAQRNEYAQDVPDENPLIKNIEVAIQNTATTLLENIRSIKDGLKASRNEAQLKLGFIEGKIKDIPTVQRQLFSLERESQIRQGLYTYLLQKRAETAILLASTTSDNRVVDMARTSYKPVKPIKNQTYAIAVLLGLIFPAAFIYFRDLLNDRISDRHTLEQQTKIPVLGMVGFSRSKSNLIVAQNPESQISEAFRGIRTNLQYFNPEKKNKIVLVTSTISSEGKSFCSANLASIIALSGKRVILIGCDMRKPKKSEEFNLKKDVGISNYLAGNAKLDEIIQPFESIPNLQIILSGPKPPNPSQLIESDAMAKLFDTLHLSYDYVIIDSPPIGMITDSMLLSRYADVVVYVVRQNVTRRHHLDFINSIYKDGKLKNPCIILNAVRTGGPGYGYGHGYGYGYYEEDSKSSDFLSRVKSIFSK